MYVYVVNNTLQHMYDARKIFGVRKEQRFSRLRDFHRSVYCDKQNMFPYTLVIKVPKVSNHQSLLRYF
jgi:hypothetical protein